MFKSLRFRLAIAYAAILAVTLFILIFSLQLILTRKLTAEIDQSITARGDRVELYLNKQSDAQFPNVLQSLVDADPLDDYSLAPVFVNVLDVRGKVLIHSRNSPNDQTNLESRTQTKVLKGETVLGTLTTSKQEKVRVYTRPLTFGEQIIGILQVGKSLKEVDDVANSLEQILILEGIAAVLLVGLAGYLLAWRGLATVDNVVHAAQEIEAQHLDRYLRLKGQPTEVQRLADTFDAMLERLHRAFEQQKQLIADVSHELRTPLTIIQGNLDVALLDESQPPELRSTLSRVRGEANRLARLVTNLLLLARSDAGQVPDRRLVDLDVLLLEVFRQGQGLSDGVQIHLAKEDQVAVLGDPDQLKQLLLNLVDNALKYTPSSGVVDLALEKRNGFARISVSDTGVGIAEEDLPHVFDRFYRARTSRMAAKSGAGLGLAIAAQIAVAHGGHIDVHSTLGKGTTFEVCLPLP